MVCERIEILYDYTHWLRNQYWHDASLYVSVTMGLRSWENYWSRPHSHEK